MSKNILILSSSPRRGGNSDTLCDEFMRGAIESGNQVEKIFLRDKNIHPCTGCSVCSRYKKPCPQKDDAAEVIEKMLAADVIVMGTPVYFYAMSAQMKMMIDRCCGPYTEMKNKEFYFIATAAEEDETIMDRIVANFMGFLDCLENPTVKGTLFCGGVWPIRLQEAYRQGISVTLTGTKSLIFLVRLKRERWIKKVWDNLCNWGYTICNPSTGPLCWAL